MKLVSVNIIFGTPALYKIIYVIEFTFTKRIAFGYCYNTNNNNKVPFTITKTKQEAI